MMELWLRDGLIPGMYVTVDNFFVWFFSLFFLDQSSMEYLDL